MNELKTEIINLFESGEMKECMTSEYDFLHITRKSDIIKGARIGIQKKLELLKKLYESIDESEDLEIRSYHRNRTKYK